MQGVIAGMRDSGLGLRLQDLGFRVIQGVIWGLCAAM